MNKDFINRFDANRSLLKQQFEKGHPNSYQDIVEAVINVITTDEYGDNAPDPKRIHQIDYGDYQGTLLFIIAEKGYQPNEYYSVKVGYGSCSGCDTLQQIRGYTDEKPTEAQINDYMTLALHILQGLKQI